MVFHIQTIVKYRNDINIWQTLFLAEPLKYTQVLRISSRQLFMIETAQCNSDVFLTLLVVWF